MSYRTKTCAYCNGNHAILDCPKLPEDAKRASEALQKIANNPDEWRAEAAAVWARYVFNEYLPCDRDVDPNTNDRIFKYDYVSSKHKPQLLEHAKQMIRYRCGEVFEGIPESDWVDADIFDTFPTTVKQEDRWNTTRHSDQYRPSRLRAVVDRNKEVQDAAAKRSKKSCSYCRGEGHTVRTCTQKRTDVETYHDAFKISAYLSARAMSRFGLWTSSMIKDENQGLLSFKPNRFQPFMLRDIEGNDEISTKDLTDCVYFLAQSERHGFYRLNENERYSSRTRIGSDISKEYLQMFDLKNNRIDVSVKKENEGLKNLCDLFLPVVISTEHIFKKFMESYKEPAPSKDRYSSPEIGVGSCKYMFSEQNRWRNHVWISGSDLYDRKKRNEHCFAGMSKFIDAHQDELAEANKILNKS